MALPLIFTARATLLPPGSQQQSGSAAALAALGGLGGLAGGLAAKTPDELYVALLKSDTVQRALAQRFDLETRWKMKTYEELRRAFANYVRISSDKKTSLITVEVDDEDPAFAAKFANAYADEITRLMGRLAVSEAQARRVFFEQQLKDTKENLIAAELGLRKVQETSGVIVLDKQAEALISGAAKVRAQIAEREVALSVLRRSATAQNPDVQRLGAEVAALRVELSRMESSQGGDKSSPLDLPVSKLSEAGIDYVRARRELKIQEMLLEGMIRQYEIAKLDVAKEGPVLQQVDVAVPPDRKSKPARAVIVASSTLLTALVMCAFAVWRGYRAFARDADPEAVLAWSRVGQAWHWRR
jgi:capsule polysaccharide export protein KpsE/RkpR